MGRTKNQKQEDIGRVAALVYLKHDTTASHANTKGMIGKMVHKRIRRNENGLGNGLNIGVRKRNTKGKKMILKRDRSVGSKMAIGELVSTASYQSDKCSEENKSEDRKYRMREIL